MDLDSCPDWGSCHMMDLDSYPDWGSCHIIIYIMLYYIISLFLGYLLDNLAFCGSLTDPSGMDPDSCPDWGSCDNQADVSFWESVSKTVCISTLTALKYYFLNHGN